MSSGSLGGWGNWSRAAPGSSADGYIFRDGASGHLRCSDAAWPFVTAVPMPLGRAMQPSTRQCDTRVDDFLPGECGYLSVPGRSASTPQKCHWRQHPHRGPDTAYIVALHNTSAWKAVEGGRFAHGRHGQLSRCHCRSGVCSSKAIEKWTFRPHTGCSRIGPIEGVARLRSRPLTFLGDSTTAQYWSALATINAVSSRVHWPQQVVWFCVPESAEQFKRLLQRAGLWRDVPGDGGDAVLVISLGAWPNVNLQQVCQQDGHWNRTTRAELSRCRAAKVERLQHGAAAEGGRHSAVPRGEGAAGSSTLELTGQDWPVPAAVTALPEWKAEAIACTATPQPPPPTAVRSAVRSRASKAPPPDPCTRGRGDLCRVRQAGGGLNQCDYAQSSARLAAFFSAHRAHLPRHVFVLDSPPSHGGAIFDTDNGRWRTRTRSIWQQLAPWVSLLPASEMLVPHVHARNAKVDFQHWCLDSSQMEEYLSSMLTAITSVVGV